jgi:hypothetical protein
MWRGRGAERAIPYFVRVKRGARASRLPPTKRPSRAPAARRRQPGTDLSPSNISLPAVGPALLESSHYCALLGAPRGAGDQRLARRGCERGRYGAVLDATGALMRRAYLQAASLLERHSFLERFGQVAMRALGQAGAERTEITATRRLFAALQQSLPDGRA